MTALSSEVSLPSPQLPEIQVVSAANKDAIKRQIQQFADQTAAWEASLAGVRVAYCTVLSGAASLPDKTLLPARLENLSEFIETVSADILRGEASLRKAELDRKRIVRSLHSQDLRAFAQSQLGKMADIGIAQHNAKVDLYYFLLALRADYDPDAKVGAAIESAEDLKKFFSEIDS
jgi:hypothetical protein